MDATQRMQEIGMARSASDIFNDPLGKRGEVEDALIALLQRGQDSLRRQPPELLDRLFVRAIELRSVEAAGRLVLVGANVEHALGLIDLAADSGKDRAEVKRLIERAVEIGASRRSTPTDAVKNMADEKSKLHQSFLNHGW
jgi:hypothetical protein